MGGGRFSVPWIQLWLKLIELSRMNAEVGHPLIMNKKTQTAPPPPKLTPAIKPSPVWLGLEPDQPEEEKQTRPWGPLSGPELGGWEELAVPKLSLSRHLLPTHRLGQWGLGSRPGALPSQQEALPCALCAPHWRQAGRQQLAHLEPRQGQAAATLSSLLPPPLPLHPPPWLQSDSRRD